MNSKLYWISVMSFVLASGCSPVPEKYGVTSNSKLRVLGPGTSDPETNSPTTTPSTSPSTTVTSTSSGSVSTTPPGGNSTNNTGVLGTDTPATGAPSGTPDNPIITDMAGYIYVCGGVVCDAVEQEDLERRIILAK